MSGRLHVSGRMLGKDRLLALGLMSGTSCDGVDAALVETDGRAAVSCGAWLTEPYDAAFQARLRAVLGGRGDVAAVERELTERHAEAVRALLTRNRLAAAQVDIIGFHGQTILHEPERRRTWQIGADRVRMEGKHWPRTIEAILARVAHGLGVGEPIEAALYKLLVYDEGSFFVSHRDTEKVPGMFATLVVALPSTSAGGELVVRHKGREVRLDLRCEDPSEAAFAAFYADCVHEVLPVTAGCRSVKSPAELALMRHANQVTLKAYEAAYKSLTDGMTQDQFARLVSLAHQRLGYQGSAGVQVGEYSALPHGSATPQIVRPGTILLIDGGCRVEGYNSDMSRTFVLGKASDRMKKVFEIEHRAQTAALEAARPGVECQAVDAAARKVITGAGFGPGYKNFTHRVGHGIGMDGHEWPYLVKGNTLKLAPGMTFSDEPGIYIPGEFGVRLEDDMVITENGAELFTPQSPSLEDPFGSGA